MTRQKLWAALSAVLVLLCVCCSAQTAPTPAQLAQITERGRALAAYDQAAWHATDAVRALNPPDGVVRRYIAQRTDTGWKVGFGRINDAGDAFLLAYEATQGAKPDQFTVQRFESPRDERGFYLTAARAIDLALRSFRGERRPYNAAVLPDSGHLLVYIYPAQTENDVYPLGGDERYTFDAEGKTILEDRRLHKTVLESKFPPGVTPEMGYHIAVLDERPEDTDVFCVLSRKPTMPELIVTHSFAYRVNIDGTITFLGTANKFLGR